MRMQSCVCCLVRFISIDIRQVLSVFDPLRDSLPSSQKGRPASSMDVLSQCRRRYVQARREML